MVGKQKSEPLLAGLLTDEETQRQVDRLMKVVGARVREFRDMQGLSSTKIRDEHNFNVSQLSRIENGKMNLTTWTAVRLAYVLGVRPWDFYVPREDAPTLKPKREHRPPLTKAELQEDNDAFRQQVGRRIRSLRKLQGMSAAALEDLSGVPVNTLGLIERGRTAVRTSTVIRIADAIGVRPHELYLPREQSRIRPRTERPDDDA